MINEKKIIKQFFEKGYTVINLRNDNNLKFLCDLIKNEARKDTLKKNLYADYDILNNYHKSVSSKNLNKSRLRIINKINHSKKFRNLFYSVFKNYLDILVGNELVMQKRFGLSIQMPNDQSSLLPVHSDVWSGDSPFEVVAWLPLVNVYKTKSMYILPPKYLKKLDEIFKKNKLISSDQLFIKIKKYVEWIELDYGEAIIFNQTLPHGNVVNKEHETRWTINCRFKGIFTPYGDKKLGEFFEPISLKPASEIALKYKFPNI